MTLTFLPNQRNEGKKEEATTEMGNRIRKREKAHKREKNYGTTNSCFPIKKSLIAFADEKNV